MAMIHPGDTVTLTTSWDSVVVPDAQIAAWLNANPWAVRYHWPKGQMPTVDVLERAYPRPCRPVHSR